ncbi:hypothetical protein BDV06DRAFT_205939 [Aspergillus oleicola]
MMGHHSANSPSPTIQITVLTIATLLILIVLILIIGPSHILSDSACSCPQTNLHLDISANPAPGAASAGSSSTGGSPGQTTILNTDTYSGTHLRKYKSFPPLTETHITDSHPDTWEGLFSPYIAAGGLHVTQDSVEGHPLYDDFPDVRGRPQEWIGHGITMMHQLHCLIMIRGALFPANNNIKLNSTSSPPENWRDETSTDRKHMSHCFEYLAQTIICSADDTLEPPHKEMNDDGKTSDWFVTPGGAIHQCKDPRPIWEMSVRMHLEPGNMSDWRPGIGAREYFADELRRTGYQHEIPNVFQLGVLGGGVL